MKKLYLLVIIFQKTQFSLIDKESTLLFSNMNFLNDVLLKESDSRTAMESSSGEILTVIEKLNSIDPAIADNSDVEGSAVAEDSSLVVHEVTNERLEDRVFAENSGSQRNLKKEESFLEDPPSQEKAYVEGLLVKKDCRLEVHAVTHLQELDMSALAERSGPEHDVSKNDSVSDGEAEQEKSDVKSKLIEEKLISEGQEIKEKSYMNDESVEEKTGLYNRPIKEESDLKIHSIAQSALKHGFEKGDADNKDVDEDTVEKEELDRKRQPNARISLSGKAYEELSAAVNRNIANAKNELVHSVLQ